MSHPPDPKLDEGITVVLRAHEERLHDFFERWMKQNEGVMMEMRGMLQKCMQGQPPRDQPEVTTLGRLRLPEPPLERFLTESDIIPHEGTTSEHSTFHRVPHGNVQTDEVGTTLERVSINEEARSESSEDEEHSHEASVLPSRSLSKDLIQVCGKSSPADLPTRRQRSADSVDNNQRSHSTPGLGTPRPALDAPKEGKSWIHDILHRAPGSRWQPVMVSTKELMGGVMFASKTYYEVIVSVLIVFNALWIGFQLQYLAVAKDSRLDSLFSAGAIFFCVVFTVELLLRFVSYAVHYRGMSKAVHVFLRGHDRGWNIFDLIVVSSTLLEQVLLLLELDSGLFKRVSMLRSVRLARLFRVLRIARVLSSFREFRVLILSIAKGLRAMVWTMVICIFMVYIVGIGLAQGALEVCHEPAKSSGDHPDTDSGVCKHFGSLDVSMMSVFKAIFGGIPWGTLLEILGELDVLYSIIFLMFVLFVLIVILNTVAAIFIDIQIEAAQEERDTVIQDMMRNREKFVTKMINIFQEIDMNNSGCISIDELELAIGDSKMDALLSSLQLDVDDAKTLFEILDADGSGSLSIQEFITGCLKLRGGAKAMDMAMLKQMSAAVLHTLRQVNESPATPRPAYQRAITGVSSVFEGSTSITNRFALPAMSMASIGSAMPVVDHHHHRSIPQVEMRAMTLKELRGVCSHIEQTCMLEHWKDLRTGDRLVPQSVDLYHFNHYQICPATIPHGCVLEVTHAHNYQLGQLVVQHNPNNSESPLAEGFVKENSNGFQVKVDVTRGKFKMLDNGNGGHQIWLDDSNVGELTSVSLIGNDISYKELVSTTAARPTWFCSHWWGEPVFDFVSCCESHAEMRGLDDKRASYWVCAYANRQHDLLMDIRSDPDQSSFRKAMRMAGGVLLVLDDKATPFRRIWCGFELYRTLCDNKMLDIVTMVPLHGNNRRLPQLLSERPLQGETPWLKAKREQSFPIELLIEGICVKLEDGDASVSSDKERILEIMTQDARRQSGVVSQTSSFFRATAVRMANTKLNAYFAQAAWPRAVKQGTVRDFDKANPGSLRLPDVLRQDESQRVLILSLGHTIKMDDKELKSLADGFPQNLVEMDLSFEICRRITDAGLIALAHRLPRSLTRLHLDFLGCDQITDHGLRELASCLPAALLHLRLDFVKCTEISDGGVQVLAQCLPMKLQSVTATFKGTRCDRNFSTLKDLRSMMSTR